jgi:PmbA protein
VRHPVKNLRFTESMIKAFSSVEALSRERSLEPSMLLAMVVPAMKIAAFRFSGVTEF